MSTVTERYLALQAELAACAETAGRDPKDVQLVCVSKQATLAQVQEAFAAGARVFGENRIEVMTPKASALPEASWHFIGNIQSRKIPEIVQYSALIHSVWKLSHLPLLNKAALACGKVQDILVEVNVSGEESKDGLAPEEVSAFVAACEEQPALRVRGLMCMAPQGDLDAAAQAFAGLASIRQSLIAENPAREATLTELSMGMSEDWHEAVEAGSTMIRLGRAVFSDMF